MHDASLMDSNLELFMQVAAQKVRAAKIPVAAVCYYRERLDLMGPWFKAIDLLGCWHQMLNDLFDWHKDMGQHNQTYFLSEAGRRRAADEPVDAWVIREGFAWGCTTLHAWMTTLKEMAQDLSSPGLLAYLEVREALFAEREAQVRAGFQNLARLLAVFPQNDKADRRDPSLSSPRSQVEVARW